MCGGVGGSGIGAVRLRGSVLQQGLPLTGWCVHWCVKHSLNFENLKSMATVSGDWVALLFRGDFLAPH